MSEWKVRKTKTVGVRTFWEVYRVMPGGETIFRGRWTTEKEAQDLANKLNKRTGGSVEKVL